MADIVVNSPPLSYDLEITKGSTVSLVIRWEATPFIYKAITAVTKAAPVAITSATHGLKTGWRTAVISVGGMRELKAKNWPLRSTDFNKCTVSDTNTITLNEVNSTDYTTYTSGGFLAYYTPVSLASFTARMKVRATALATTELLSLTSSAGIALDDTEHTITVVISAATTAAFTFSTGVYDFELASGDATPVVTKLLSGNVTVLEEVTW